MLTNLAIAAAIAVVITALLVAIPQIIGERAEARFEKRVFERFSRCNCRVCGTTFGAEAVQTGKDTSPMEELWSDGKDSFIHCFPTCRVVTCPSCGAFSEIRFNHQGPFFGPEVEVREPDT
jgi:hypothetical protein